MAQLNAPQAAFTLNFITWGAQLVVSPANYDSLYPDLSHFFFLLVFSKPLLETVLSVLFSALSVCFDRIAQ
jgi:hypothetical protein